MNAKAERIGIGLLSLAVIVGLWSAATHGGFVRALFLPAPDAVLGSLWFLLMKEAFLRDIGISVLRISVGFGLGALLAIPVGVLIGSSRKIEALLEPIIDFIRYTPIPAFIPLFILWFGIGEGEKIFVIGNSVFFQLVLMVADSVVRVPRPLIESARTLGATRRQILTRVVWPFCKPRVFDDLRVSLGWAWAGLMIAEMVGSTSGIGFVIIQSQRLLQTDNVIAAILVVGTLGLLSDLVLKRLYGVFFPWTPKVNAYAHA